MSRSLWDWTGEEYRETAMLLTEERMEQLRRYVVGQFPGYFEEVPKEREWDE